MKKRSIQNPGFLCFSKSQNSVGVAASFYLSSFLLTVSCGSPPSTPSRPLTTEAYKTSQDAASREQVLPSTALLEKTMSEHLLRLLIDGERDESPEIYSIELANADDIQKFNDSYVCKTKLGVAPPQSADDLDQTVAESLVSEVEALAVEHLQIVNNLSASVGVSSKRIVFVHNIDMSSCDVRSAAFSMTDKDMFLISEVVYVPVGTELTAEESVEIGISALSVSVNRGALRSNRDEAESTSEHASLEDANRLLDSFASVLVTLPESNVVSIAPVSLALAETVPGTSDQALLYGIERIVSVNLALVNNNQIQQPSQNPNPSSNAGAFLTGIFSWFTGLVASSTTGGAGQQSPIGNLPNALGLLTTSPQLILANALLQVFLNGGLSSNGQPTAGKPVAALSAIPDYAGALGLTPEVNFSDLISLLTEQSQYIDAHFEGRIRDSLKAYLALSYSQGFRKRLPLVAANQENP